MSMKCSFEGCPGEYEHQEIIHAVRHKGEIVVIDHVPAEVCSVCGDVLLHPEIVRQIEALLQEEQPAPKMALLYEYA